MDLVQRGLSTGPAPTSIEQSVAVLPFVNMSGNPDNEYFSDGITEEILNALAQIPDLRVPFGRSPRRWAWRTSWREASDETETVW